MSPLNLPGVWTPRAEILCWSCHGPDYIGAGPIPPDQYEEATTPREAHPEEAGGTCDACGAVVWIDAGLAAEQRVATALKTYGASMAQTGGMCSAVHCPAPDGRSYVLVFANEEGPGFNVALFEGEAEHHSRSADVLTVADVVATVRGWFGIAEVEWQA